MYWLYARRRRQPGAGRRQAELAAAHGLVKAVSRGRGATLLVTGEAGMGKSGLVAELAALASGGGLTVFTGHAVQGGTCRAVAEGLARPTGTVLVYPDGYLAWHGEVAQELPGGVAATLGRADQRYKPHDRLAS